MFLKRLKYKPKQCTKCHKWGHFATQCCATTNTCRTCRGDHITEEGNKLDHRYCMACQSEEYASWDRSCPKFQTKSTHFNKLHPENALTYFPTGETWTAHQAQENSFGRKVSKQIHTKHPPVAGIIWPQMWQHIWQQKQGVPSGEEHSSAGYS